MPKDSSPPPSVKPESRPVTLADVARAACGLPPLPIRKRKRKPKVPPGYDVALVMPDGSWVLKPKGEPAEQTDNVTEFEAWRARHAVRQD